MTVRMNRALRLDRGSKKKKNGLCVSYLDDEHVMEPSCPVEEWCTRGGNESDFGQMQKPLWTQTHLIQMSSTVTESLKPGTDVSMQCFSARGHSASQGTEVSGAFRGMTSI